MKDTSWNMYVAYYLILGRNTKNANNEETKQTLKSSFAKKEMKQNFEFIVLNLKNRRIQGLIEIDK